MVNINIHIYTSYVFGSAEDITMHAVEQNSFEAEAEEIVVSEIYLIITYIKSNIV